MPMNIRCYIFGEIYMEKVYGGFSQLNNMSSLEFLKELGFEKIILIPLQPNRKRTEQVDEVFHQMIKTRNIR